MRAGNSGVSSARINTAIAGACVLFITNLLAALIIELDAATAASEEITVAAPSGKGVRLLMLFVCFVDDASTGHARHRRAGPNAARTRCGRLSRVAEPLMPICTASRTVVVYS